MIKAFPRLNGITLLFRFDSCKAGEQSAKECVSLTHDSP
ncbi:hypothetical protein JCM19236_1177 [Vibrio sp. JCM 19236]|nr:hypothetical protein JCM19236_1177 [Vibrio sp. JCM 19236]